MPIRLPDAPPSYDAGWAAGLVRALGQLLDATGQPSALPRYTIATLPKPKPFEGCLVYVTNGLSNQHIAVSDGTAWRYPDGSLV